MSHIFNAFTKNRSKSKAMHQEQYPPCLQNAYSNIPPPQQAPPIWVPPQLQMQAGVTQMPYHQPQAQVLPMTQQAHPPYHTMHTQTMNACLHPCQPQNLIQSPQHQQQQQKQHQSQSTFACQVNGQARTSGGTPLESRILSGHNQQLNMSNGGLISNGHHQMQMQHIGICQPHHQAAAPQAQFINHMQAYSNNQVQSSTNQAQHQQITARFDSVDNSNSYYSNNQISTVSSQQQQQQVHQQQFSRQVVQQEREKIFDEGHRQDQHKANIQQNGQSQRQVNLSEQQRGQNNPIGNIADMNGHSNPTNPNDYSAYPLEVACKLYHKDYQDLMSVAEKLKVDLSRLNQAITIGMVSHGMLGSTRGGATPYKPINSSQVNGAKDVQNRSVAVERFELHL